MKKMLIVLILMGINGGVYAGEFSDLGVTTAELKARASMNEAASLSDPKIVAVPVNSEEFNRTTAKAARILARPSAYSTDELLEVQIDLIDLGRNGALSAGQKSQVSEYTGKLNRIIARRMPAAPRQLTYSEVIARTESILSNPSSYKLDDMYAAQLELIGQSIKGGLSAGQKSEVSEHLAKLSQVIQGKSRNPLFR